MPTKRELNPIAGPVRGRKPASKWYTKPSHGATSRQRTHVSPVDAVLESVFPDQKYLFRHRSLHEPLSPLKSPPQSRQATFLESYCPVPRVPLLTHACTDFDLLLNPDAGGMHDTAQLLAALNLSADGGFVFDRAYDRAKSQVVPAVSLAFSRLAAGLDTPSRQTTLREMWRQASAAMLAHWWRRVWRRWLHTAATRLHKRLRVFCIETRDAGDPRSLHALLKDRCIVESYAPGTYVLPRRDQPNAVFVVVGAIMIFFGVALSLLAAVALDYWYNDMPAAYLSLVALGFIALLLVSVVSKLLSEITDFSTARNADAVAAKIVAFEADVVVGCGYGSDVVSELVARTKWAGPTLLVAPNFVTPSLGKRVWLQTCGCTKPLQMPEKAAKTLDDGQPRSYSLLSAPCCTGSCHLSSDLALESVLLTYRCSHALPKT
ncbi:hypothetical protein ACHHYP_09836 [Achlya hypogyna]|uniref:Transmembrane protein n=1 Tax=Achlya hypogyna TaxID=1202772 RepID=A0A1V9YMB1_ACHHY|nr:hypothetical protein ACHHYP_09836 [Achlya hypogyna]